MYNMVFGGGKRIELTSHTEGLVLIVDEPWPLMRLDGCWRGARRFENVGGGVRLLRAQGSCNISTTCLALIERTAEWDLTPE